MELDTFSVDQLDGDSGISFNCLDFGDTTNFSLIAAINLSRSLAFWQHWQSSVTEFIGTSFSTEISRQEAISSELEFKICFIFLFPYATLSLLETDFIGEPINDPTVLFISSLPCSEGKAYSLSSLFLISLKISSSSYLLFGILDLRQIF